MLSIQLGVPCLERGSPADRVGVGAGVKVAVALLDVGSTVAVGLAAVELVARVVGTEVAASVSVGSGVAVSWGVSVGRLVGVTVLVWVAVGTELVAVAGAVKMAATLVAMAESLKA